VEFLAAIALLPLILIAWVLLGCGALSAWVASTRGRGPMAWYILGIILGPLALIAVGLSGDRDRS